MRVAEAMSTKVLVVSPEHTVAEAARLMVARRVGAAVVLGDDLPGPGIVTERDVMRAVAEGRDCASTVVREVMTFEARTATTTWDLDTAAEAMVDGGFRHLLVVDERGDLAGIVSMRDVVRARLRSGLAPSGR